MTGPILRHQSDVGNQTPMPTDRTDDTSVVATSTAETVAWLYSNSGVWASGTGQAAGTIVTYKTTYTGILNSANATLGHSGDTSLSFAVATRASQIVGVPESVFSQIQHLSVADQVVEMTKWLDTAGDYAIDHRRGQIWCNSKDTVANDAVTYDYATPLSGGGAGDKVDLIKVAGTATSVNKGDSDAGTQRVVLANDSPGGSGGGSAGGGNNTYSTEGQDFTATVTDATNNIVLSVDSVGGVLLTEAHFANAILKVYDASATTTKTITLNNFTWTSATKTLNTANCTGAFLFATADKASLTLVGPPRTEDTGAQAQKTVEQTPLYLRYIPDTIVNTTNVATGTKYYLSMAGYSDLAFSGTIIDAAHTTSIQVWGTCVPGSTTATDYVQIYFRDEEANSNVNSISVTSGTKYFLCSYEGIGKITDVYFLVTTADPSNTIYINTKRKY